MKMKSVFAAAVVSVVAVAGIAVGAGGTASQANQGGQKMEGKAGGAGGQAGGQMGGQMGGEMAMQLPPGWTMEDMQAMMAAGTPGKQHEWMAKSVGTWKGRAKMYMAPNLPPMETDITNTVTTILGGRYLQCQMTGEMPGMGAFTGQAIYGFDNVSQKFVSTWIDNMSTGMMHGTGQLSADGTTLTWTSEFNCPITKKMAMSRQIETYSPDGKTMTFVMYTPDPKSGKEFKAMEIEFKR